MFGLGAGELLLIFVIALLFLGPKKLPELAKGLGQALREFQKAKDDMMTEIHKPSEEAKNHHLSNQEKIASQERPSLPSDVIEVVATKKESDIPDGAVNSFEKGLGKEKNS